MKLAFLKPHQSLGNMDENDWTKRKQIESLHRKRVQPKTIKCRLMLYCGPGAGLRVGVGGYDDDSDIRGY